MPELKTPDNFNLINGLPIVGPLLKNFDKNVERYGLNDAVVMALNKFVRKYEGVLDNKTKELLKTGKVLLIVNHDHDFEMIPLIGLLPKREDIYMVGASHILGIGKNSAKHLIPVYIRGKHTSKDQKVSYRLAGKLKLFPQISDEEAHRVNIQSISDAADKINKGGLVIIFPSGVGKKGGKWFNGVGHLVGDLGKGTHVINVYVKGTTNFDLFRLVPFLGKLFPNYKVWFSSPESVENLLNQNPDPKEITKILGNKYNQWASSL